MSDVEIRRVSPYSDTGRGADTGARLLVGVDYFLRSSVARHACTHTAHCTLHTAHCTLHTALCTLHTALCTPNAARCTSTPTCLPTDRPTDRPTAENLPAKAASRAHLVMVHIPARHPRHLCFIRHRLNGYLA